MMINYLVHGIFVVLHWMLNHQWKIVGGLFVTAFLIGSYGFVDVIKLFPEEPYASGTSSILLNALVLGFLNLIVGHTDNLNNALIMASQTIAYLALTFAVIIALLRKLVAELKLKTMNEVSHSLVVGLGENNRTYLTSEAESNHQENIIIIESDPANVHLEHFRDRGFGVFVGTLDDYKVNFSQLERVVISTGSDRVNIEMAGKLISMIPEKMTGQEFGKPTMVHVHLQNQDYKSLFQQKILGARSDLPLEFKPYSFNDDSARQLFENHTLLGNYHALAKTDEPYAVVVVGDGDLAERIIYHMCMQANFPNKNHLSIHCVSEDAPRFLARIRSNFTEIDSIACVTLEGHSLLMDTPEFYNSDVWKQRNLTNVIVCHGDENINLECTVNLHDKVFLRSAIRKRVKTKVHFAMYHNLELSRSINDNKDEFNEFYTFGDAKAICGREHFIDEKNENIAKLIHFGYAEKYNKNQLVKLNLPTFDKTYGKLKDLIGCAHDKTDKTKPISIKDDTICSPAIKDSIYQKIKNLIGCSDINTLISKLSADENAKDMLIKACLTKKWHDTTIFTKRESNRSQALHINTKLMALGLKKVENNERSETELLSHNHKMMEPERKMFPYTDTEIVEISEKLYSDKREDQDELNRFFEEVMKKEDMYSKLTKAEHERWNTFHYLNGWIYDKSRDDTTKRHNCLVPMEEFSDVDRRQTIIYDLYATLYIPNYLASTGYQIETI